MKVYYLKLTRKKAGILCAEPVDEEIKIFSSVEKMEEWLLQNDFIYGQMDFFKYKEGEKEWCKKKATWKDFVITQIFEMELDNLSESKFSDRNLRIEKAKKLSELKWLVEFVVKKLRNGLTVKEIAELLEKNVFEIRDICAIASRYAPDYDVDKIFVELLQDRGIY